MTVPYSCLTFVPSLSPSVFRVKHSHHTHFSTPLANPKKHPRHFHVFTPIKLSQQQPPILNKSEVSQPTDKHASSNIPSLPLTLAILNLTTVLWGTQHAVIKLALNDISPSTLNFTRFALAALLSAPGLTAINNWRSPAIKHGIELSLYLFAGYALQSAALLTTTASRSAFLLYLNVKLVPLFARVLYGRPIAIATWASAALALLGTCLLTYDGSPPVLGDAFSVAAAAASALFILRTENAAQDSDVTPASLNAVTLTSVTALMGIWAAIAATVNGFSQTEMNFSAVAEMITNFNLTSCFSSFLLPSPQATGAVVYLAVITTALCNYLQAVGQKGMSAERAAVVFAMDPVYGAFFAWILLGESLGSQGFAGAFFILGAALLSGFADSKPQAPTESESLSENDGTVHLKSSDVTVPEKIEALAVRNSTKKEDSIHIEDNA